MSIKSAIQHLHSMFDAIQHPGAIPADIKEYALKGIKSELEKLLKRVEDALPPEPVPDTVSAQGMMTADAASSHAVALSLGADPTGAYAAQPASLIPDYLPPQSAVPVHGDEVGPAIDLAAGSNADPT